MKALQLFKLGKLPMRRCDLLLSKPRELPTGAFFLSRNSGESVPCGDKWSKRTSRILTEYYLRIQYIRLWVREPPQVFIFPLLWICTFTCSRTRCARVRGVAGILFKKASRQTATIATSCSIWPHEILAFTTSAFPSFYFSYIQAHFQVFTMQSHAAQLSAMCADAVMWVTLPASYFHFRLFLSWRRWG